MKPINNIVYLKPHKTASTTLMSILYRYGDLRNLSFVLVPATSNDRMVRHFRPEWAPPLTNGVHYNIFARHTRFNKSALQEFMPKDSFYITIIRGPLSHFQSRFDHYRMKNLFKLNDESPIKDLLQRLNNGTIPHLMQPTVIAGKFIFRNPLLFELGMEPMDTLNETLVRNKILELNKQFDLVLLAEYFDESLVLMKRLLHWDYIDIMYMRKWWRKGQREQLTSAEKKMIMDLNSMDSLLYQHFNRTLWEKFNKQDSRFWEEVKEFKRLNEENLDRCVDRNKRGPLGGHFTSYESYPIKRDIENRTFCNRMAVDSWVYTAYLIKKQFPLLKDPQMKNGFTPSQLKYLKNWTPFKGYS